MLVLGKRCLNADAARRPATRQPNAGSQEAILNKPLAPELRPLSPFQRRLNTRNQVIFCEKFVQIAYRPSSKYPLLHSLVWKCGHEYRRHAAAIGNKPVVQLDTTEAGHFDIRNQTSRGRHFCRSEEFLGRPKSRGFVAERSHQGFRGFSYGFVIVNDRDHRYLLQFYAPGIRWNADSGG